MTTPPYAHPLALERLVDAKAGGGINVLSAAIAIATNDDPKLQPRAIHEQIDCMTRDLKVLLTHDNPIVPSVRHVIFDRYGFSADAEQNPAPDLLLLHRVFARRCGASILISLLITELARRGGASAGGIGLPGRFLALVDAPGQGRVFIEPFHGGKLLTPDDCRRLALGNGAPWNDDYLNPIADLAWVQRLVLSLHQAYGQAGDLSQQAATLEMMLILGDDSRQEELQRLYGRLALKSAMRN